MASTRRTRGRSAIPVFRRMTPEAIITSMGNTTPRATKKLSNLHPSVGRDSGKMQIHSTICLKKGNGVFGGFAK